MSIARPTSTITIAGSSYTNSEIALRSIEIEMSVDGGHDLTIINCSNLSPLRDAQVDDTCTISLGYENEEEDVFNGVVTNVSQNISEVCIEVMAATYPLSQTYLGQAYENQTIADIINDLAGQSEVEIGAIDATITLGIWHVTEQRSAWWHINNLAKLEDCEVLCDEGGALIVRPVGSGGANHTLRYGAELIVLDSASLKKRPTRSFAPSGVGSELGEDKWHITLREPVGDSPENPNSIVGAIRYRDAAKQVTQGYANNTDRQAISGKAYILGNETIRPGDLVDFEDIPEQDNLTSRVTRVKHQFDCDKGFVTTLSLEGEP